MIGVQESLRIRVVQFFERIQRTNPDWKRATVLHLMAEGVTESTVFRIINRYNMATGTTRHRKGARRPRRVITNLARVRLRRLTNHRTGISQRGFLAKTWIFMLFRFDVKFCDTCVCCLRTNYQLPPASHQAPKDERLPFNTAACTATIR